MAYAAARQIAAEAIPVIDIGALRGGAPGAVRQVADEILKASAELGFFYVRNHGLPEAARDRAVEAARAFFAQPMAVKQQVAVNRRHRGFLALGGAKMYSGARSDLKESFNFGLELPDSDPDAIAHPNLMGPNQWPQGYAEMRPAAYGYYEAAMACGHDLMRAFAVGMDLPEDFFRQRFRKPLARGSILYYPPQPPDLGDEQFGVAPHTDYGCLTLLWQDSNGGLEVKGRSGEWLTAHPIPDTLVINVGDLLARWSNDRFASTPHRVVNRSGRERYSMAVFFDPDYDAVIDPRDANPPPGATMRHEPVTAGAHIEARFDAAFKYRQQQQQQQG
ncbi:MAG: 2-oxoglutarate and iron-dependent oxygenase domain-containing protein [Thalassobaculales bacterium]